MLLKVVVLIDNAPTHPGVDKFLPANVTSLIQPMDQGAIETLKRLYKRKLLGKIIDSTNDEEEPKDIPTLNEITIKDVIYMTAASWDEVKLSALNKAWKKILSNIPSSSEKAIGECYKSENEENLFKILQTLDGPSEIQLHDVLEWI